MQSRFALLAENGVAIEGKRGGVPREDNENTTVSMLTKWLGPVSRNTFVLCSGIDGGQPVAWPCKPFPTRARMEFADMKRAIKRVIVSSPVCPSQSAIQMYRGTLIQHRQSGWSDGWLASRRCCHCGRSGREIFFRFARILSVSCYPKVRYTKEWGKYGLAGTQI